MYAAVNTEAVVIPCAPPHSRASMWEEHAIERWPWVRGPLYDARRDGWMAQHRVLSVDSGGETPRYALLMQFEEAEHTEPSVPELIQSYENLGKEVRAQGIRSVSVPTYGDHLYDGPVILDIIESAFPKRRVVVHGSGAGAPVRLATPSKLTLTLLPTRGDHEDSSASMVLAAFADENRRPWHRKQGCYHPSSLSLNKCARAMAYDRLNVEPVRILRGEDLLMFELGHTWHDVLQRRMKAKYGERIQIERTVEIPELAIYGHADGLIDSRCVWEIKSIAKASFEKLFAPKVEHIKQATLYMAGLGVSECDIMYVCRDNAKLKSFRRKFDQKLLSGMVQKIEYVETMLSEKGELPPREVNRWDCGDCNFAYICKPQF